MAKKKPQTAFVTVPVEWQVPENIVTHFATNLTVQCQEHDTFISFFEVNPFIFLGTPEENIKAAQQIKSIRAKCVARISIATSRFPEFIEAMKQGHDNFLRGMAMSEAAKAEAEQPNNGRKK